MTSFDLTDEQRLFRDTMRSFVDERIAPNAAEADRTASYPWKSFEACRELELPALGIPAEYGGPELTNPIGIRASQYDGLYSYAHRESVAVA